MKKLWIPTLIVLALGGFAVAKVMTAKKTATAAYRAKIYLGDGGQWYAQVFDGAKPIGEQIGPLPTEGDAAQQAAEYLAGLDVVAFYTLHTVDNGPGQQPTWFFDGWSRGVRTIEAEGPYTSEAIANAAGTTWAKKTAGES